ncbi:uncharacterized protein LTR77_001637 [Saxophila tyrrhenica]|uniref:Carboxylic ester hydrolase n=1 Tax=Saxophila tyrrhenica TaxID=1690608 RepID=A0AAV9PLA1_9PEZI|nr:hypothetical protein LTR77_001637 [Saxophila tyrrhenica]
MKVASLALLYLLQSTQAASPAASPPAPVATDVHGSGVSYHGIYKNSIEAFLGIRYAHDTGGEYRFKPPRPYTPDPGSRIEAKDPGSSCPQRKDYGPLGIWGTYDYVTDTSEDCLRLNVWRPNGTAAGDKLPVLVYIHGGSFLTGNKDGILAQLGGMQLHAIDNGHPIMNVELNYRLGVFGFAQTGALLAEGSTNAGIRDQRAALEWVRDNIAAFGGDPDKITIHGQSSGGLAVGMQIMAYGGTRPVPFQQAICQSQALEPGITGNSTRKSMARAWSVSVCASYSFDSAENVACLRSLPMQQLLNAQLITHTARVARQQGDNWLPVVDGDIVPAAPSTLIAEHRFANVSAMIGWTVNDAVLFTNTSIKTPHETYHFLNKYMPGFTVENVEKMLALYPSPDFQPTRFKNGTIKLHAETYRAARIYRDLLFTCQPIHYGQALAAAGNPVYFYNQNQSMLQPLLHKHDEYGFGVVHTAELIYVFGNLTKFNLPGFAYHPRPSDHRLASQESRSWSSFVAVGQPSLEGHDTLQGWKQADFDDDNYGVYVIGGKYPGYSGTGPSSSAKARKVMLDEKLSERCGFINSPEIVKEMLY